MSSGVILKTWITTVTLSYLHVPEPYPEVCYRLQSIVGTFYSRYRYLQVESSVSRWDAILLLHTDTKIGTSDTVTYTSIIQIDLDHHSRSAWMYGRSK